MNTLRILACVTGQKSCERLIVEGAKMADAMNAELSVLHVAAAGTSLLGYPLEGDAMEYLYKISSEHGADMTMIRSDDVIEAIARFAIKNEINIILMGAARKKSGRNIALELQVRLPGVEFQTIYADED
ncbi:universal stress protein [Eubacteriales bacterium OttesenSCG-928-N13]|nr:universal stress protein [Eubacteriales bacterium OttesenSCG-928-N13]